ncbi:MAG: ribonuclease III [Planctomycetota bacterium]|nr:ribonuclease III [Planctomycetota bacterium]MDP7129566.1 ribonuclease III [Planctomycetota bacterium]MDP7254945.1 ribonuclease III [Planctomycetota bacterium]
MTESERTEIEGRIGYNFIDPSKLELALTHSSSKSPDGVCNERQEFLGDAILGMVISEHLYRHFPDYNEGELTRIKSVVVSRPVLAVSLKEMGMDSYIRVGRGLGQRKLPRSVLANVFEAIICAIYEDCGLEQAQAFILFGLKSQILTVIQDEHEKNYKSLLQQYTQKEMASTPTYKVVSQKGPDHSKQFQVVAVISGKEYISGWGRSKKEAEQRAAEQTLSLLAEELGGQTTAAASEA